MLNIVFDANIYLAAMGSRSFCYDLFLKLADEPLKYPMFISEPIIREVEKNAQRLQQEGIINASQKEIILHLLKTVPHLLLPEEKINFLKDNPKDNKILECAAACEAHLIITMDRHLFKLKTFRRTGIIHPKTFLYMMEK